MLAVVAGGTALFCLYRQVDEEIRCRVEKRLADHYRGLKVRLRSAQLVEGRGIRLRELSVVDPTIQGPRGELLHVEEALLECPTDWQQLASGEPPVRRVTVRRPAIRASQRPDGGWTTSRLLPPPSFGEHPPEVVWEGGSLEISDPSKASGALKLRDINLVIASTTDAKPSGARRIRGTLAGDGCRRIEVDGWLDMKTSTCAFRGKADGIEISPELGDSLPRPFGARLAVLGNLRGQASCDFDLAYDASASPPLRFNVKGRFARGWIDDARLPQTLTDIRAAVRVDNSGFAIDDLNARIGQATVRMSCRRTGFEADGPLALSAEVRRLELDRALLNVLPQSFQDQWYKYSPAGTIDADVQLAYDGRTWKPTIFVQCLNVSFMHHKFPYRLDHGRGTLEVKNDVLTLNMTAAAGGRPVRLASETAHPFSGPTGWFEAKGDDVPIDETLLVALPEKPRDVVRSLDPHGSLNFYIRMWRDRPDETMHQHLLLSLNRCSIQYKKFPYPLSNIRGVIEMFDGEWTFRNLDGGNGGARVTCEGRLAHGLQGNELILNLVGRDVALEETLRDALSPSVQQIWYDLRPRGIVDLTAEVRYLPDERKFSVGVRSEPQPGTASIDSIRFPYRFDKLQGVLLYRDGHVDLQHFRGEHGAVKVAGDGTCDFQPDGSWTMRFTNLSADRLRADRELVQALPDRLRRAILEMNPTGAMNLRGSIEVSRVDPPGRPLRALWDVHLGIQQSMLQCGGLQLENVCGDVGLAGGFDGEHFQSRGALNFDSVQYKDCQLTQVAGPIWIDDGRLLFGSWVDRREGNGQANPASKPRPITARLFGGTLFGDGWITFEREPRYAANLTLTDADLASCAKEFMAGRQKLSGKIMATADLSGTGRSRNALSGRGGIRLTNADLYELPVMISLLKILSIRPPDQNAFSDAIIRYRIEGEHIYFDNIDFHGDAISLRGKGEMDFQSSIRLTFYALVGRGELDVPVVKQVFRGASQQLLLLHVDGTLQNPETHRETLPAVNQALQQIRDELQNRR